MENEQLHTMLLNEVASVNRKLTESIQAWIDKQIKAQLEKMEKRESCVIEHEKKLTQQKEALDAKFAALEQERSQITAEKENLARDKSKIASENEKLARDKSEIASRKDKLVKEKQGMLEDMKKLKNELSSERDELAKEKTEIASERDLLAKKKRMMDLDKEDLVKERQKIASDQEGLAFEREGIANQTKEERQLLEETEAKLKERDAQLKEREKTLNAREQKLAEVKNTELDLKSKLAKLEEDKEKFEKWKAEEESTLQMQRLTLQRSITAKPNPMEELASRGWMSFEDFFDNLARLKSVLNVSDSTLSGLSELLERLQSKKKIVGGLIKIDNKAMCITLGKLNEDGFPGSLFSESSSYGLDFTLRTLYNSLLSKVRQPTLGCESMASLSSFDGMV